MPSPGKSANIKWSRWEFWAMSLTNIPVFGYWMVNAFRSMDPAFFSAVNPALNTGGFYGNSKEEIFALDPGPVPARDHLSQ